MQCRRVEWQRPIFRRATPQVSSGLKGLTAVFGMGTGGDEGIRTPDLRRAKAALSQLSYGPGLGDHGWANLDSNQGPQSYQDCALAN